jgi:hypothetical protein
MFSTLVNATELLQTQSWTENLPVGGGWSDWGLRIGTPLATLILGNYGITPTVTMNAVFLISGTCLIKH